MRIRCDESGEYVGAVQHADGIATVGGDLAYLTPERCLDLYRLAFDGEVTSSQTARAIAVLAHEAWHLHGVRDEGTTECYALQSGVGLGQRLGLSEGTAEQMMRQQLAENAGRSGSGTEYVVPPSCRDGGALDLDPERAGFPLAGRPCRSAALPEAPASAREPQGARPSGDGEAWHPCSRLAAARKPPGEEGSSPAHFSCR